MLIRLYTTTFYVFEKCRANKSLKLRDLSHGFRKELRAGVIIFVKIKICQKNKRIHVHRNNELTNIFKRSGKYSGFSKKKKKNVDRNLKFQLIKRNIFWNVIVVARYLFGIKQRRIMNRYKQCCRTSRTPGTILWCSVSVYLCLCNFIFSFGD